MIFLRFQVLDWVTLISPEKTKIKLTKAISGEKREGRNYFFSTFSCFAAPLSFCSYIAVLQWLCHYLWRNFGFRSKDANSRCEFLLNVYFCICRWWHIFSFCWCITLNCHIISDFIELLTWSQSEIKCLNAILSPGLWVVTDQLPIFETM